MQQVITVLQLIGLFCRKGAIFKLDVDPVDEVKILNFVTGESFGRSETFLS